MECSNGTPNLKPFQLLGSRLSLCFKARVMAWPLIFSTAGMVNAIACGAKPKAHRNRHGRQHMRRIVFLAQRLSRMTAQPGVLTSSTFSPCLA